MPCTHHTCCLLCLAAGIWCSSTSQSTGDEPWARHIIDRTSRGADGVRLADVNGDGKLDVCTGWEEGGLVRVYLHPGKDRVRQPWPAVTVGRVASPEDAVFADLDGDKAVDVVSSCEGKTRTIYVHWAPSDPKRYLDPEAWTTAEIPATKNRHLWMYALPMNIDGQAGVDLVVGSKSDSFGWLQSPINSNPRKLADWMYHPLYKAGWTMSIEARDMNRDSTLDLLVSDRKGKNRGLLWLEHPQATTESWLEHRMASDLGEVMFLDVVEMEKGQRLAVAVAVKPRAIVVLDRKASDQSDGPWRSQRIEYPETFGTAKAVRLADINLDGQLDIVATCEQAVRDMSGVFWLSGDLNTASGEWEATDIGGPEGVKFDRIELVDLDEDGDLDLITCEEQDNLGVIWYENWAK
jgi:hypothetical protein